VAASALGLAACGERAPEPRWPEGALLSARTPALARLLERLAEVGETPLGRRARALRDSLPDCALVEARAPSGHLADALDSLGCASLVGPLAPLHELRGAADLAFALPLSGDELAGDERALGVATLGEAGDLALEISLPAGAFRGARSLLVPGDPPGPGVLAAEDALVHARLRPAGGLDVASLVPEGSQGAELFGLKSQLFAGLVLDGSYELAIYLPADARTMPDAALALGFSQRETAVAAMDAFLGELQSRWPVSRTPFAVGDAQGACLLELRLLPELAPCYVATAGALVVGWNPASLRRALAAEAPRGPESALVIDLARLPEADLRLAAHLPERPERAPTRWPWRRLRADGASQGDGVRLRVQLEAGA